MKRFNLDLFRRCGPRKSAGCGLTRPRLTELESRLAPAIFSLQPGTSRNEGSSIGFYVSITSNFTEFGKAYSFDYQTIGGSAQSGVDFVAKSGTISGIGGIDQVAEILISTKADSTYEPDETFSLSIFNPSFLSGIGNSSATATILNNDPLPTVSIKGASQYEGNSGSSPMYFSVSLSNPSYLSVNVNYHTSDITAEAPSDYTSKSGAVTISPGQTAVDIPVSIFGDSIVEGDQTFRVTLDSVTGPGAKLSSSQKTATGTIIDDEYAPPIPSLSILPASILEGNGGTTNMTVTIGLSAPSLSTVTVKYETTNGGAVAPSDFHIVSGTVTFPPQQTQATFTVPIVGDTVVEPNEQFNVTISNPTNATIATAQANMTIVNDDTTPPELVVTNTNDSGFGSLRNAINFANNKAGADTITFQLPNGFGTIVPPTPLPAITDMLFIDGWSQPGFSGKPIVEIKASASIAPGSDGLVIKASNSVVRGLAIYGFPSDAIEVNGASGFVVDGCYLGLDKNGNLSAGNSGDGIYLVDSPSARIGDASVVQRNVISGNLHGIRLSGTATTGTVIQGNYIGTNVAGTGVIGNAVDGILIESSSNIIGGTAIYEANLISGNVHAGIAMVGAAAKNNTIIGNWIGIDVTGQKALLNPAAVGDGILVAAGAGSSTIRFNFISGNASDGIAVVDSSNVSILGNYFGLNIYGTTTIGNGGDGILAINAPNLVIGAGSANDRNTFAGNMNGIHLTGQFTTNAIVRGNYVGTNAAGTVALGNSVNGILVESGSNTIGGTGNGEANFVAGNVQAGIALNGALAANNLVIGNWIGIDITGTMALVNPAGSSGNGISISGGASSSMIQFNFVSGNGGNGITIADSPNISILGNYIGLNIYGTTAIGNGGDGIYASNAAGLVIGKGSANDRNTIAGNRNGIRLVGASTNATIRGNYVGTDAGGTAPLGNELIGILIESGSNTIGGTGNSEANFVAGNGQAGIALVGPSSKNNLVIGNWIGVDLTGTKALVAPGQSTGHGIMVSEGADSSTIRFNFVSGNGGHGVAVLDSFNISILGNYLGLNIYGTSSVNNGGDGVYAFNSSNLIIGSGLAADRNVISGNLHGVAIEGATSSAVVQGNYIGLDAAGTKAVGNVYEGILFYNGASNSKAIANVIAANGVHNIQINGANDAIITGNLIGLDATGNNKIGNTESGIRVWNSARTIIGGSSPASRNVIGGHTYGIRLQFMTHDTLIRGNYIGTNVNGTAAIENTNNAIQIDTSNDNTIGGAGVGEGNLISGSGSAGVAIVGSLAKSNSVIGNVIGLNTAATASIPNLVGVFVGIEASANTIKANLISGNTAQGVVVAHNNSTGNSIRGNSITANGGLGIDLGGDGVTANDTGDGDSGPNGLLNFPSLFKANAGTVGSVIGLYNGVANTSFTVEFFANAAGDPTGYGEGQRFLGSGTFTTNGGGNATYAVGALGAIKSGEAVTATVSGPDGSTSEFAANIIAAVPAIPAPKVSSIKIDDGTGQRSVVRSLTITFNQSIDTVDASAFMLTRQDGGSVSLAATVDYSGPGTVVVLTFIGGEVDSKSLRDGRYNFSISASKVTTVGVVLLDGNGDGTGGDDYVLNSAAAPAAPTNIFRLFGDADGNGSVTAADFNAFRLAYGSIGPSIFDFDGDNQVSASDFNQFRTRFGITLVP